MSSESGVVAELTEALSTLQEANAGVTAAAEAMNAGLGEEGEPATYPATAEGVAAARADAQYAVDAAQAELAGLTSQQVEDLDESEDADLAAAATTADLGTQQYLTEANLNRAKANIQAQIDEDETLAELQQAALDADAAVAAARADGETDVDALNATVNAINAYLGAGGDNVLLVESLENFDSLLSLRDLARNKANDEDGFDNTFSGNEYPEGTGDFVLSRLAGLDFSAEDGELTYPAGEVAVEDGVLTVTLSDDGEEPTGGEGTWTDNGGNTYTYAPSAEEQAIVDAVNGMQARSALVEAAEDANQAFQDAGAPEGGVSLGAQLAAIETRLDAIGEAKQAVADAEAAQADANALIDALEAALADQAEAEQWFDDNGYELPVTVDADGVVAGTTANDIFLFDAEASADAEIGNFGTVGEDRLFFGEDYNFVALEETWDEAADTGDASALEIFWSQDASGLTLYVEDKAFAGNASSDADITEISLAGVADFDFADGYLTAGTAA